MTKVAVVTDSVACLTKEQIERYGIRVVPINVLFGDRVYRNGVDLSISEAYAMLDKDPERFATSPASPGEYLEAFRELIAQGAEGILCLTVSSKLSIMFNMASVAKDLAQEKFPQTPIQVMDTRTASASEGLIALAAARAAAEGKSLGEVAETAQQVREAVYTVLVLETIRHVYRTGRMPKLGAQLGSLLPVKPILTIADGAAHIVGVARTMQRGVDHILETTRQRVGTRPVHVAVMHADAPAEGERLKERISSEFNCVELYLTEFSPVMGYATGRGVLGLAYYAEA